MCRKMRYTFVGGESMDTYVTGKIIKDLRTNKKMTQEELALKIGVTDKAISKWETGHGLPDISLLEPLANALSVSVTELISGKCNCNKNVSANVAKSVFKVCPVCGNVIFQTGDSLVSCCGVNLPVLVAEQCDEKHGLKTENVEDETYVSVLHPMTKTHYVSFVAYVTYDACEIKNCTRKARRKRVSKTKAKAQSFSTATKTDFTVKKFEILCASKTLRTLPWRRVFD